MKPEEPVGNGLADPSQQEIEKRGRALAVAAGRDEMNEADLAEARREVLGPSASTEPVEDPKPE
ncbi:MAG: hypothetical protein SFU53_14835 [Terrimicrobiaceae bacterium]|nr:hypothetical protein [Terrimicrobiaceae bacterium]